jgi:hypothetical protein
MDASWSTTMTAEEERTRLIGDIARVLRAGPVPDEARTAALTFIGWLARRMPGEPVSTAGVSVMIQRASRDQSPVSRTKPRTPWADADAFVGALLPGRSSRPDTK